jgi:hypothetical protein
MKWLILISLAFARAKALQHSFVGPSNEEHHSQRSGLLNSTLSAAVKLRCR